MTTRHFGLDTPLAPPPLRRRSPRRLVAAAVVGVLAAAGGGIWAATASPSGPHGYRTANVTHEAVQQTVEQAGTIEPVAQATVAFPTSGTVDGVAARPGESVAVGQTLATLDTTALEAAVLKADATLAAAQLTLQRALAGQTTQASSTGTGAGSGGGNVQSEAAATAQAAQLDGAAPSSGSPGEDLHADQQAVLAAQQTVDSKLLAAEQAVAAATTACSDSSWTTTSTTTSTTTKAPTTTTMPGSTGPSSGTACSQALASALAAEQALAGAQQALAAAAATLTTALADTTATPRATTGSSRSAGTTTSHSTASQASTGTALPSAADLIADQAAVDAARLQVAVAQQSVAQAAIVSPIAGVVAQVALAPGQRVTAGSSTADVVVVGAGGGYEVATTVTVDQLTHLAVGAPATVQPDGSGATLAAKVVSIGVAPTATSTATVYPVVLGITAAPAGLRDGATAAVTIVLSDAGSTLAVPTSAVQTLAGRKVVAVLSDGKATPTVVTTGAVGDRYTAISSGLTLGQTVVLADLSQPLPSSDNSPNAVTGLSNVNVGDLRRAFAGRGGGGAG